MPSDPVDSIMPRSIENPAVAQTLRKFSEALDELVNFGTHVLKWCWDTARGTDENVPLLMLFRHALELIDSVSRNIEVGSADPCRLLLRGMLECVFGIKYILQEDTHRRSMAFLVYHVHESLKWHRMLDPSTDEGKRYRRAIERDAIRSWSPARSQADLAQRIKRLRALLRKPLYVEAEREYQNHKPRHWYTFFGGPGTAEGLASRVKLPALYELFYRQWSAAIHATDVIEGNLGRGKNGKAHVYQMRNPKDAQSWTATALWMGLQVLQDFVKHFVPHKTDELKAWYAREVQPTYTELAGPPIIAIVD